MAVYSPSQISTYLECPRKWAWRSIAKIQTPDKATAQLGTETHKQLQRYIEEGPTSLDFTRESGYIAASGLRLLPTPKTIGIETEAHFTFTSPKSGLQYQGYIDLRMADSALVPGLEGGVPCVIDHKTTGDLKWAKTEEELEYDVQAVIYAHDTMVRFKSSAVDLAWIYYQTKGPKKAKRVHLRMLADHAAKVFDEIEVVAAEMDTIRGENRTPLELPPNVAACGGFGGCPYREHCTDLSPLDTMRATMTTTSNGTGSLLSRLKAKQNDATEALPKWAAPVEEEPAVEAIPLQAINPPEYQPEPPADAPEETKKKRGRPKKELVTEPAPAMVATTPHFTEIADQMRAHGIQRLAFNGMEIEMVRP